MAIIGSLNVLLQASTSGLASGLDKAEAKLKGWGGKFTAWKDSISSRWGGVISVATVGVAAVTAAAAAASVAFISLSKQALDNAGRLDDLAQNLGATVDHLHALEYAAHRSGVSASDLESILGKLNLLLAEAAINGGPTAKALEKIGLNASELTKLDITDAFKQIAKALSEVEHEGLRSSLAMDILGKAGTKAIQFVAADIEGLEARAKRLGIVMSQVDADKLNAAQDAMDDIGFIIQAAGAKLAADLAPALVTMIELFTEGENTGNDMLATMNALADVGVVVAGVALGIGDAFWDGFTLARQGLYEWLKIAADGAAEIAKFANKVSKSLGRGNLIDESQIEFMQIWAEESRNAARDAVHLSNAGVDFYNKYTNATNTFSESLKKNRAALEAQAEAMNKGEKEAEKWIEQLQEQLQVVGMTTDEAKLWKLEQQEINSVLTDQARALLEQIKLKEDAIQAEKDLAKAKEDAAKKAAEAAEKEAEEIKRRNEEFYKNRKAAADAVRESVKTEKEKKAEERAKLQMLFNAKEIDQATFDKATKKLNGGSPQEVKLAGLAMQGTQEARASIIRNENMNPQNKIVDNTAKTVVGINKVVDGIAKLAAGIATTFVAATW